MEISNEQQEKDKQLGRTYNLLEQAWIPVLREDGTSDWIVPYQLTEGLWRPTEQQRTEGLRGDGKSPIMRLNSNRADFNAAIAQFLIGLFQTAFAPETEAEWEYDYKNPPTPDELEEAFAAYKEFFWLDGEGARFMQDGICKPTKKSKKKQTKNDDLHDSLPTDSQDKKLEKKSEEKNPQEKKVKLLLFEEQENPEELNTDVFIKRNQIEQLGLGSIAAALILRQMHTQQINYHFPTSLRGRMPFTSLLLDNQSLWRTIYLNLLPNHIFYRELQGKVNVPITAIFPWCQKGNLSKYQTIFSSDSHPLLTYWSMPRCYWLGTSSIEKCSITNIEQESLKIMYSSAGGTHYQGTWLHPLSPTYKENLYRQASRHIECSEVRNGYDKWLGLVQNNSKNEKNIKPSLVVDYWLNTSSYIENITTRKVFCERVSASQITLWSFGFLCDNQGGKVEKWIESKIPIIYASGEYRNDFEMTVKDMILASQEIAKKLKTAFTTAAKRQSSLVASDATLANAVEERFWRFTESEFYQRLQNLKEALEKEQPDTGCIEKTKLEWIQYVRGRAESIFLASLTPSHLRSNPKQYMLGMQELKK